MHAIVQLGISGSGNEMKAKRKKGTMHVLMHLEDTATVQEVVGQTYRVESKDWSDLDAIAAAAARTKTWHGLAIARADLTCSLLAVPYIVPFGLSAAEQRGGISLGAGPKRLAERLGRTSNPILFASLSRLYSEEDSFLG